MPYSKTWPYTSLFVATLNFMKLTMIAPTPAMDVSNSEPPKARGQIMNDIRNEKVIKAYGPYIGFETSSSLRSVVPTFALISSWTTSR